MFELTNEPNEIDESVANGEYDSVVRNASQLWAVKRQLFQKIQSNSDLLENNSIFVKFINEHADNSIGNFHEVDKFIQEAITGNTQSLQDIHKLRIEIESKLSEIGGDGNFLSISNQIDNLQNEFQKTQNEYIEQRNATLQQALILNEQIIVSQLYEINEKELNKINIKSILKGSINEDAKKILLSIAQQCPAEGGMAVYRAISMLSDCDRSEINLCENDLKLKGALTTDNGVSNYNFEQEDIEPQISDYKINVFPNPSSGSFSVSIPTEAAVIFLTDIMGKVVYQRVLEQSGINLINHNLESGMYLLKINLGNGNSSTKKLIIE